MSRRHPGTQFSCGAPLTAASNISTEDLLEIAAGVVVENVQLGDLGLLASAAARPGVRRLHDLLRHLSRRHRAG